MVAELRVRADVEVGTVTIGMQSKDSGLAVDRVNAFARATVAYFADELRMEGVEVTLVEEATPLPNEPSGAFVTPPTRLARTVVAGVLGLLFGIALVVVVEALGARLRSRQEVASALALPVFAEVPRQRRRRGGAGLRLTVLETPRGEQADGYRALKAAVLQAQRESISATDGLGQVVLVSSVGGEIDVSEVVANLAMTIAIDELSVLAVEADLREPGLHRWFDVPESDGVVGFLGAGPEAELEDYVRPTLMPKVSVLTAGSGGGDHPAFWVSQFPALVAEARAGADVVLLAASPILQASEVLDLLPLAQTVVIAVESGRLPAASARRLAELMTRFSHSEAGVVLFGADPVARKRRSRS
ncbi:hypothetical protein AADG42_03930 [Ammonicoccus fulvus]|uniref:Polysaccharide chain length determinant N-terminal domain-containing protein n=1 Tax=Ammonicoccus fulvus TaxID=3138240 RepID=A0ABZ3FM55_9ACTN